MGKISTAFGRRAQRAKTIPRRIFLTESRMVRRIGKEGLKAELYSVTTLPTTGKMLRSLVIKYMPGGFALVFDASVAPYAGKRAEMKGNSKKGGHRLDMNIRAYVRRRSIPLRFALWKKGLREIAGNGVTSINGG